MVEAITSSMYAHDDTSSPCFEYKKSNGIEGGNSEEEGEEDANKLSCSCCFLRSQSSFEVKKENKLVVMLPSIFPIQVLVCFDDMMLRVLVLICNSMCLSVARLPMDAPTALAIASRDMILFTYHQDE